MQDMEKLDAILALLDGGDLKEYALNTTIADRLIKEISEEIGASRLVVRLIFKLVGAIIFNRMTSVADNILASSLSNLLRCVLQVPGISHVLDALHCRLSRFSVDFEAREALSQYLKGASTDLDADLIRSLSQELQVELLILQNIERLEKATIDTIHNLRECFLPQPALTTKLLRPDARSRLIFSSRWIPFYGRAQESGELSRFLNDTNPFCWWTMLGAGGSGKSRLALELIIQAGLQWRAGFLEHNAPFEDWQSWEPERPTLIVIDYAAHRVDQLRMILLCLSRRHELKPLTFPVRVLLLERFRGAWFDDLTAGSEGRAIEQAAFREELLEIGELTDEGLWQIASFVAKRGGIEPPPKEVLIPLLAEIDKEARPLFAALAGEAIGAGADIRKWGKLDVLADIFRRERDSAWRPHGFDDRYQTVLALSTFLTGLRSFPEVVEVSDSKKFGLGLPHMSEFDYNIYEGAIGRSNRVGGSEILHPLEPDILGEYFVLEHIERPSGKKLARQAADYRAVLFRELAWSNVSSGQTNPGQFLQRLCNDFSDHRYLDTLILPPTTSDNALADWAYAAVAMVPALSIQQRPDLLMKIMDAASYAYHHRQTQSLQFREQFARLVYNCVVTLTRSDIPDMAVGLLMILSKVVDDTANNPSILLRYLRALAGVLSVEFKGEILEVIEAHFDNAEMALEVTLPDSDLQEAYCGCVINYVQTRNASRYGSLIEQRLNRLYFFVERFTDRSSKEVGLYLAGAFLAGYHFAKADDFIRCRRLYTLHRQLFVDERFHDYLLASLEDLGFPRELAISLLSEVDDQSLDAPDGPDPLRL